MNSRKVYWWVVVVVVLAVGAAVAAKSCARKVKVKLEKTPCLAAFVCAAQCGNDDCLQGCLDGAGEEAQELIGAIMECAAEHGCDQPDPSGACLKQSCAEELHACMR